MSIVIATIWHVSYHGNCHVTSNEFKSEQYTAKIYSDCIIFTETARQYEFSSSSLQIPHKS